MQFSNFLCCPVPYAMGLYGYNAAVAVGLLGLALRQRGSTVQAAAAAAYGRVTFFKGASVDAGLLSVGLLVGLFAGLSILSIVKMGPCQRPWYIHTFAAAAFIGFGHCLLLVEMLARRPDGALALDRRRETRVLKVVAFALSPCVSAPLRLSGYDLECEYLQILTTFTATLCFERDVAAGAARLAAGGAVYPAPAA